MCATRQVELQGLRLETVAGCAGSSMELDPGELGCRDLDRDAMHRRVALRGGDRQAISVDLCRGQRQEVGLRRHDDARRRPGNDVDTDAPADVNLAEGRQLSCLRGRVARADHHVPRQISGAGPQDGDHSRDEQRVAEAEPRPRVNRTRGRRHGAGELFAARGCDVHGSNLSSCRVSGQGTRSRRRTHCTMWQHSHRR